MTAPTTSSSLFGLYPLRLIYLLTATNLVSASAPTVKKMAGGYKLCVILLSAGKVNIVYI